MNYYINNDDDYQVSANSIMKDNRKHIIFDMMQMKSEEKQKPNEVTN